MLEIKTTINVGGSISSEKVNIGCSDTLDNISGQELWENSYVAAEFNHVDIVPVDDGLKGPYNSFNPDTYSEYTKYPVYHTRKPIGTYINFVTKVNSIENGTEESFIHVIWLCMPLTTNPTRISKNNPQGVRVALDFNPQNFKFVLNKNTLYRYEKERSGTKYFTDDEPDKETIYDDGIIMNGTYSPCVQIRQSENVAWRSFSGNKIVPCGIIKIGDKFSVFDMTNLLSSSSQTANVSFRFSKDDTTLYNQCADGRNFVDYDTGDVLAVQMLALDSAQDTILLDERWDWRGGTFVKAKAKNPKIPMGASINRNGNNNWGGGIYYAPISYGGYLEVLAKYGMLIEGWGTTYKPIIKDGIVTGYTDDLTVKSEFDDYREIVHEGLPDKPIPADPSDYDDDPWGKIEWGGAYLGAGNFTNLWYCTATDLENLRRWMNGVDTEHPLPEGFNPMNQILGLMQFPIGLGGTLTEELTMRTQANVTVHSGVMINRGFGDDLYYNLGSIDIPLRMKERGVPFLDYGSTVELYVPFCGVFQLDPQTVLGADLSVEMWLSPVTGECNCIVSVGRGNNRGPVAFGSGNMAADIPVTANGYGLYAAAAKEASLKRSELMLGGVTQGTQSLSFAANTANTLAIGEQIAGESIAGAWGAAGATVGGVSAAIGLGVALAQATHNIHALDVGMQHAKNASGTSVSGSFSGTSAWHYPFTAYVKITRPRYKIPSNYAHTQGIPLVKAQSLSECNGFTMCVGTDLSSVSATEIEKEQIAAFLSNGVIV